MLNLTLTVAPGIWRDPNWIAEEIDRVARRYECRTVTDAIERVCSMQHWRWQAAAVKGGVLVSLWPLQPRSRVLDTKLNLSLPIFPEEPTISPMSALRARG